MRTVTEADNTLFSVLTMNPQLVARITADLRSMLSPRHGPDEVSSVPSIPRKHSGKKLECR